MPVPRIGATTVEQSQHSHLILLPLATGDCAEAERCADGQLAGQACDLYRRGYVPLFCIPSLEPGGVDALASMRIYIYLVLTAAYLSSATSVNLNHFKLLRVVGKGAFGKVRIVERKDTGLTFALKYIRKDEGQRQTAVKLKLCADREQWSDPRASETSYGSAGCWNI